MIWNSKRVFWKRRFALLPIVLDDGPERQVIWLQWVWARNDCLYTSIDAGKIRPDLRLAVLVAEGEEHG